MVHLELVFGLVAEGRYLSVTLPKLKVVTVYKLFCLFLGLCVIGAIEVNRAVKMAVRADDVNAIIRHDAAPLLGGSVTELSVTDRCRRRGGDVFHMAMGPHSKQATVKII
jgi:hypothetical protein